jgi:hypothetical protein
MAHELANLATVNRLIQAQLGAMKDSRRARAEQDAPRAFFSMILVLVCSVVAWAANADWSNDPSHDSRVLFGAIAIAVCGPLILCLIGKRRYERAQGIERNQYLGGVSSAIMADQTLNAKTDPRSATVAGIDFALLVVTLLIVMPIILVIVAFGTYVATCVTLGIPPNSPRLDGPEGVQITRFSCAVAVGSIALFAYAMRKARETN